MKLGVAQAVVDEHLVVGDVDVADGVVRGVGLAGRGSGTAVPAFVDLQLNGFAGVDLLSEPERAGEVDAALARRGVLAWQPTLTTAPPEDILAALPLVTAPRGAIGAHLEGPFLSPERAGAHPREHLHAPDPDLLRRFVDTGVVTTVTLAPELPGALELVELLVERGVAVWLGHSNATAAQAAAAFDLGARTVTHLFNAMRPFGHRDPGVAGAALACEHVFVTAIVDGVHLAPETVAIAERAARGRFAVVSDAVAATGLGDGVYRLGSVEVTVADGACRRADGTLAGGVATLDESLSALVGLGVPFVAAIGAVTAVPARIVGRGDLGVLAPGRPADLVVLDDRLRPARVLRGGEEVA